MKLQWLLASSGALLAASLLLGGKVSAQTTAGEGQVGPSPYSSSGPVSSGLAPGYTGRYPNGIIMTPRTSVASPHANAWPYGAVYESPAPIFMTSINYPGVYGAYTWGANAWRYNLRPSTTNYYDFTSSGISGAREVSMPASVTTTVTGTALPAAEPATINVTLPSDASLWFQGQLMTQAGSVRQFVSPALTPGEDYHYDLRASWMENGREVTRQRRVQVHAGDRVDVDLLSAPSDEGTSTLRSRTTLP